MFVNLMIYHCDNQEWGRRIVNINQIVSVMRCGIDGVRVDTSDGKYFFVDASSESVLFDAIGKKI